MAVKSNVLHMKRGAMAPRRQPQLREPEIRLRKSTPDLWLLLIAIFLVGIGVIMVFSSSYYDTLSSDPYEYLKRQAIFAGAGLVIVLAAMNFNYQGFRLFSMPLMWGSFGLLIAVYLFKATHGSHRWIPIGETGFNIQPSEIAKFTLSVFMANLLRQRNTDPNHLGRAKLGWLVCVPALMMALVLKEPDLGATVSLACIALAILVVAGLNWFYTIALTSLGCAAVYTLIQSSEYQMSRIMGFLDPWADPLGTGYQLINSFYALGSGGFWGAGIGASRQKLGFLPEQNTDFIFSIAGEELGFLGAGFIVVLFLLVAWRGYLIAMRCPELFGCLLAVGITTSITIQAVMNLGVVTGCLPVTGVTLPFVSYGGSSLLMCMGSVGVLLNISRYRQE
jgi:cell division protein FtsW